MKSFKLLFLCVCSFFAVTVLSAAEQKDPLRGDPRYVHVVYFLQSMNMDVDEKNLQQRQEPKGTVYAFNVVKAGEQVGLLWLYNDTLTIGVNVGDQALMYTVSQDTVGKTLIEKQVSKENLSVPQSIAKSFAGYGVCQYKFRVSLSFACSLDDQFVLNEYYTWVGSPITQYSYTWRTDFLGRTFACPLNSQPGWNPKQTYTCGAQLP